VTHITLAFELGFSQIMSSQFFLTQEWDGNTYVILTQALLRGSIAGQLLGLQAATTSGNLTLCTRHTVTTDDVFSARFFTGELTQTNPIVLLTTNPGDKNSFYFQPKSLTWLTNIMADFNITRAPYVKELMLHK
jgi:hypothetical protein